MGRRKFRSILLCIAILLFLVPSIAFPSDTDADLSIPGGDYKAALLMNADTGEILYEKNAHLRHPPASMVKMMLMLLVMEKLEVQSVSLSDPVTTSAKASKYGGSQVYLKHGEVFSLEEMMMAMVIHSANDASVAIAEFLSGSVEGCVDLMNRRARELGMTDTEYHSVDGLPPGRGDKPDLSSAGDLALLARALVKYPKIMEWSATETAPFRGGEFVLTNTNKLVGRFPGADGIKTGYYRKAGYNLTATASRDGLRMISVVLGCRSEKSRSKESSRLLSVGFNMYKKVRVVRKGEALSPQLEVSGARVKSTTLVAAEDLFVHVRRNAESSLEKVLSGPPAIEAPVVKGESYGKIIVRDGSTVISRVDAVAGEEIPVAPFYYRIISPFF